MKVKVYNLESPRTGKPVANQFVIKIKRVFPTGRVRETEVFQSYDSVIAKSISEYGGAAPSESYTIVDPDYWDYSATTLKYLKQFLGTNLSKAELCVHIKDNTYGIRTAKLN